MPTAIMQQRLSIGSIGVSAALVVMSSLGCSRDNPYYGQGDSGTASATEGSSGTAGETEGSGTVGAEASGSGTTGDGEETRLCSIPVESVVFSEPFRIDAVNSPDNDEREPFLFEPEKKEEEEEQQPTRLHFTRISEMGQTMAMVAEWNDLEAGAPIPNGDLSMVPEGRPAKMSYQLDDLQAVLAMAEGGASETPFNLLLLKRSNIGDDFDVIQPLGSLLGLPSGDLHDPHLSPNGLRLYFSAPTLTTEFRGLYMTSRVMEEQDFDGVLTLEVNDDGANDSSPTLNSTERVMVFASTRGGTPDNPDLWLVSRTGREAPFGDPVKLPLSSGRPESDPHLSRDGCTLFWSAFDNNGGGSWNLYAATVER